MNEVLVDTTVDSVDNVSVKRADLTEAVRATALLADLTIALWSGERTDKTVGERCGTTPAPSGNTGKYHQEPAGRVRHRAEGSPNAYMSARAGRTTS